ncbi:Uncharacterized conserved protein [Daejeonella lutea]|uniref:Uncharacterized conserved protein n=2 Tax=Daejeonella lutea TaxID=572036 RepID=A0A1T5DTG4_9SPHI|nr:Uncharacterized conserved protein [Daejeonella lutea]
MKIFGTLLSFIFVLCISSCKDEVVRTRTYHRLTPFYLSVSDLRKQAISMDKPHEMSVPGKIYIYGNYLFINEVTKGIHVIDNTDPASPRFLNFINIPGNIDLAVNTNILYADSYVDLLAFDISNPTKISLVNRVENVFDHQYINKEKGLIQGYKDTIVTEVITHQITDGAKGEPMFFDSFGASAAFASQSYGTGGSMARFTLMNSSLYTVTTNSLKLFNVSSPKAPVYINTINLGGGIETIFPYQNKLFIGSTTGMHIYNAIEPSKPLKLATYQHLTSCDPVIVQGKYAYVTLRSGNFCRLGTNVLDVIDIEDPTKPVLVSSFPMLNPHGLTISDNNLFICEGKNGLKAFNSSDPKTIGQNQLSFIQNLKATDVIAGPKSLIVTGADGIYQYDYTNASNLKLLSHLDLTAN